MRESLSSTQYIILANSSGIVNDTRWKLQAILLVAQRKRNAKFKNLGTLAFP